MTNSNSKPGYKSTEFWLTLVSVCVGLVLSSGIVTNSAALQGIGFLASCLASMGYSVGRSLHKGKADSARITAQVLADTALKKKSSD